VVRSSFGQISSAFLFAALLVVQGGMGWSAEVASEETRASDPESATADRGAAYARLMRGLLAIRRGAFGQAAEEIHAALELGPESPDLLIEAAELLVWTGRAPESEVLAERALEIDPDHRRALRFLSDMSASRALGPKKDSASRAEAIRLIERLIATEDAPDPDVLRMLAQLRLEDRDLEGALRATRRILEERPGDMEAIHTLTRLLLRSGREREALEGLLDFVASHSFHDDVVRWAEQLTNSLQAWELAAETLQGGAPYPPDHVAILVFQGESLLRVGRVAEATTPLERALTERPGDLRLRKDLALAYRAMGRLADSVELLDGLATEAPEFPLFFQLLGEGLAEQNDVDGALAALETALNGMAKEEGVEGQRDAIRQRMAVLHVGRDDFAEARNLLASAELPEGPRSLELRCRMAIEEGAWPEARRFSRRLADAGRPGIAALLEGEVAVGERRWGRSKTHFDDAIAEVGDVARRTIAEVYREADRPETGLGLLQEWVEASPDRPDARFALGVYLYELDRFDEAEAALRETIRLDPGHAPALNFLGYGLAERKAHLDEALELIERALATDSWNAAYLDSLGWVYYQLGRDEEALDPLERAAREMPNDSTVLEHLGDLYLRLGQRADALFAWNRALEVGSEEPAVLEGKIERERMIAEVEDSSQADRRPGSSVAPPR